MDNATVSASGNGWAVISLPKGRRVLEIDLSYVGPGFYVGISSDPRKAPTPLTPAYLSAQIAFQERAKLRSLFPMCEVFIAEEA